MRVLIVLALVGVACAGEAFFAAAPLAYSSVVVDEPKPSYEYSTSVQTPNYNNYAHVRSGGNYERRFYNFATPFAASPVIAAASPVIAAAQPIIAETKFVQPAIAQPILKATAAVSEYRSEIPIAAPAVAIPTTKLLPIAYEAKPFYRFAAPAPAATIVAAAPAPAQFVAVQNKFVGEGKSQYHSQNELGEANYGHREPFQAHDAVQDAQGNKAGSFSYVAPDGRLLTTEYVADEAGYRVASNAFPNSPNAPSNVVPVVAAQPVIAAVEKPAEIGDSEIIVEAKSRTRRSPGLAPRAYAAPVVAAASVVPAAPLVASQPAFYSNPLAYSSYSYSPINYSYAPSAYSYTTPSTYSYTSPSYYNAGLYRSYAYPSYQSYASYPSYYRSFAFKK